MNKLPPMPPNLGPSKYPQWEPINKVIDSIKRWNAGERPEYEEPEPDPESQCCGMPPLGEIFNDFAICSGCKEQADFSPQEE